MKRCCSNCSFVAAARLARPSSSRARIVRSIGNTLTLSARKAFRMMSRTNIDRMRAEEFSSKHKSHSHDSFTTKEYKSVRRRRRSLPSLLCCCRGKLFVSLSRASRGVFEKGNLGFLGFKG